MSTKATMTLVPEITRKTRFAAREFVRTAKSVGDFELAETVYNAAQIESFPNSYTERAIGHAKWVLATTEDGDYDEVVLRAKMFESAKENSGRGAWGGSWFI